ncbi:MAG: geranylgeranylglycerol-phosphate geranylgeranyltransferase [ANME-2 cluster archaeon]|nr:geranylgeranylglycerol-phosphate geranylgeranyltransferase [ANME-2 cluster archaeon]
MPESVKYVRAVFELLRWGNCAMAGFAALVGTLIAFLALPDSLEVVLVYEPVLVFGAVFLITGAGNAVNDYYDFEIDRINRPERPIPSGRVGRSSTLYLSFLLFALGIALSSLLGPLCLVLAMFNSVMLFLYASNFKRMALMGNLVVGYLTGSTFLFGGALAVFQGTGIQSTVILCILAALANLAREIIKDIQDMEGDLKGGAHTLPIKIGASGAARVAAVAGLSGVVLSPLPFLFNVNNAFGISYLAVIFIADILFLVSVNEVLFRNNVAKASKLLKMAMFVALVAFVVGAVL